MDAISKEDLMAQIKVLQFRIRVLEKQLEMIKEFYEDE